MKTINSIGIIGTGSFGTLLTEVLPRIFPHAILHIASHENEVAIRRVCECDLVIPAVPIRSFEECIVHIAPLIKEGSIVMDVCSVKEFPVRIMQHNLKKTIGIIASHPMFGPGTLKETGGNLEGLRLVLHNVSAEIATFEEIVSAFSSHKIEVIQMTSRDHDKHVASFQFPAHVIGSLIREISLSPSPINTKSADVLLQFFRMIQTDSDSLLEDMFRYNKYCTHQWNKVQQAYNHVQSIIT